jgi:hypothetical protein
MVVSINSFQITLIQLTGGAEISSKVSVTQHYMPGSFNNGHKAFEITQESIRGSVQTVTLSEETLEAIIKWGKEK